MRRSTSSKQELDPATHYAFLILTPRRNRVGWFAYVVAKRLIDVTVALLGLVALSPLLLAVSLAILVTSGWPIVFIQDRVGKDGETIRILKFRSMSNSAPKYSLKMERDDPRITPLGRFLRRSSFDELPQLINVLKGDMSLVGPRPEQPWIVERYYRPWQLRRLSVQPGITGWWQVNGRSDRPMHENTELDLYYVANQSLWLDLAIILRTIGVVVNGRGAR